MTQNQDGAGSNPAWTIDVKTSRQLDWLAAQAGVAQPSISQQLQKLERSLGYALFDRPRRKMILTDAGRALLPRASRMVSDAAEIQKNINHDIQSSPARLNIGAIPTIAAYVLPGATGVVRKTLSDCSINVREDLALAAQSVGSIAISKHFLLPCR